MLPTYTFCLLKNVNVKIIHRNPVCVPSVLAPCLPLLMFISLQVSLRPQCKSGWALPISSSTALDTQCHFVIMRILTPPRYRKIHILYQRWRSNVGLPWLRVVGGYPGKADRKMKKSKVIRMEGAFSASLSHAWGNWEQRGWYSFKITHSLLVE